MQSACWLVVVYFGLNCCLSNKTGFFMVVNSLIEIVENECPLGGIKSWGKNCWNFLNAVAISYPNNPTADQQSQMNIFIHSLPPVLPCAMCRNHFKKIVDETLDSKALGSRYGLLVWLNNAHNAVNIRIGKPEVALEEMVRLCTRGCRRDTIFKCTQIRLRDGIIVILLIVIAVIVIK